MSSSSDSNCCAPSTCVATCTPECSTKLYERIRAERPLKHEFVCSTKNCNIFGRHDTDPIPEYPYHKKCGSKVRDEHENEKSLGSPVGLVASTESPTTAAHKENTVGTRYSSYLKAFARLHLNDEKTWDALILDDIIKEGLSLYENSQKRQSDEKPSQVSSDIYIAKEGNILREFELSGFKFRVELMPQFKLETANSSETGAKGDGEKQTLANFMAVMESFFRQHAYCLLKVGTFYVMIWRRKDAYFVFDVCGRRVTDFKTDTDKGVAMLMCFRSLRNVRHLIVNLSRLKTTLPLIIRELKLVKVVTPDRVVIQKSYDKRSHEYEVVNNDYAYLRAELHLSLNSKELLRNRSGLAVAVTAIVASKIEHPATWDTKMADKIICFGVNFCQSLSLACKETTAIDVNEFPTYFFMGQFHVSIELESHKYKGTWRCVPDFKHGELGHNIRMAFDSAHSKLVLQINQQMYAIWKKDDFIYLFDPYRHRIVGKENESQVYRKMEKTGTVRMFRSFGVFMNVLNKILLDSNRTSPFFIHVVKVKNIQAEPKLKPNTVRPVEEPELDDYGEVKSLNDQICFEEAEDTCKEALGEISDFEDEDLKSDVVEIQLNTSSSEEEQPDEEELFDDWEEMEGSESTSSGEGGTHRKRSARGKRRGRGGKRGESKGKSGRKGGGKGGRKGGERDGDKGGRKGGRERVRKGKGARDTEDDDTDVGTSKRGRRGKKTKPGDQRKPGEDADITDSDKGSRKGGKRRKQRGERDGDQSQDEYSSTSKDQSRERKRKRKGMGEDDDLTGDSQGLSEERSSKSRDTSKSRSKSDRLDRKEKGDRDESDSQGPSGGRSGKSKSGNKLDRKDGKEKDSNKENEMDSDFDDSDIEKSKTGDKSKKWPAGKSGDKSYRGKDRRKLYTGADEAEADDENEEGFKEKPQCSSIPNPNHYPGYCEFPADMAFVGSECGSYESICKLFQAGFKVADRLLLMTPWGNFVIFRCSGNTFSNKRYYFLFDGCTCNFERFRHFDLSVGTAGLLCFEHTHNVIEYIRHLRKSRRNYHRELEETGEDICKEYCNKISNLRL